MGRQAQCLFSGGFYNFPDWLQNRRFLTLAFLALPHPIPIGTAGPGTSLYQVSYRRYGYFVMGREGQEIDIHQIHIVWSEGISYGICIKENEGRINR